MHDATNSKPFVQSGESLSDFLRSFWRRQIDTAEQDTPDFRHPPLPLARIKKVMKSDPDVKMIAADAPILFCKACEIFIEEITARAFIVADANKRRTLSRADIAKALSKSDQFDFLIDIVPRDDPLPTAAGAIASSGSGAISNAANNAANNANANAAGSSASGSGSGAGLSMGAPVGMGGSGGGGGHHAGYAGGAGGNGKKLVEMRGHGHPHPHGHLEDDRHYSSGQLEGLDLMQGSNRPLANIALDESILDAHQSSMDRMS